MKTTYKLQLQIFVLVIIQILFLIFSSRFLEITALYLLLAFFVINIVIMIWIFTITKVFKQKKSIDTLEANDLATILQFGEFSILEYDENYNVITITGLLYSRHKDLLSKKLHNIDKAFVDFVAQENHKLPVKIENHFYEVEPLNQERVLLFKCVDEIQNLKQYKKEHTLVIGLFQIDNYTESIGNSEEMAIAEISATLRKEINDWAFFHGVLLRRLREDRYFLVTTYNKLDNIKQNIEEFLEEFKKKGETFNVNVSASLAFVYGSDEIGVLDAKSNELLELAQARGGDQMVVQNLNGKIAYYGGNSESIVLKSNTRTRIMANSIIDLMLDSDKIFVFGHQTMDFDSMGSCIAISKLAQLYEKEVYIVSESGGIEETLNNTLKQFAQELKHHQFISDTQASLLYTEEDLVVLVDHHNPKHSAAQQLVEIAKNKIVIDHHRRGSEFVESPILTYLEASASSVCEMLSEVLQMSDKKIVLNKEESLIMYIGIVVDTNHFTTRTSSKTFEACAYLKDFGVDVGLVRTLLAESLEDFKLKSKIFDLAYAYHNVMIAKVDTPFVSRTLLSQSADRLLEIQGLDAAFVIGYVDKETVAISARSNKKINVQVIMEKMGGGGHFNAAAMQQTNTTVDEIETQLKQILEERES